LEGAWLVTDEADKDLTHRLLDAALVELAANMLRVVAGARRAWELPEQAAEFVTAAREYAAKHGHGPKSWDMERTLSDWAPEPKRDRDYMYQDVVTGGLRFAASSLLGQRTQAIAGKRLIAEAIREDQAARSTPPARTPTKADRQAAAEKAKQTLAYLEERTREKRRKPR
jgi:hypothetical protein